MKPAYDATCDLYDSAALRKLEARATEALGGDAGLLMQRAGLAGWQALLAHWPQAQRIVVACGPGNNGGDGYVLARHALEAGREVRVLRLDAHLPRSELAKQACAAFADAGGRIDGFDGDLGHVDLVVDALFGIGLSRAPEGPAADLVDAINAARCDVFALDVPSGVDADRGCVPGAAVRATRTLQFLARHVGLHTGDALDHVGALSPATLGVADAACDGIGPVARLLMPGYLDACRTPRRRNAHKGQSGHVLCVGGERGKGGAILLCAEAALRSGSGLASVATRGEHVPALLARRPEAMAHAVASADDLAPLLEAADVVAVGPGLGQDDWGRRLLAAALDSGKPAILDADALNLLEESLQAPSRALPRDCVLTPHPGEAACLLGTTSSEVQADRLGAARTLCDRFGCVVVLKGAGTVVAAPNDRDAPAFALIGAGNPGMAVGGMGDVLAGVIAALRAQGRGAFDAACEGALLHAMAGDLAAGEGGERGLLPSDLFLPLRQLSNPRT